MDLSDLISNINQDVHIKSNLLTDNVIATILLTKIQLVNFLDEFNWRLNFVEELKKMHQEFYIGSFTRSYIQLAKTT